MASSVDHSTDIEYTIFKGCRVVISRLYSGQILPTLTRHKALCYFCALLDVEMIALREDKMSNAEDWAAEKAKAKKQLDSDNYQVAKKSLLYMAWKLRQVGRVNEADFVCGWADEVDLEMEEIYTEEIEQGLWSTG